MNPSKPVDKEVVKKYLTDLQSKIVETIEMVDGKNFLNDTWQRKEVEVVLPALWRMVIFSKEQA